ncbi:MAG: alanine racemase [Actinobacteria bacterium]|nr:alanine racemase [Actinomycetota bacterium]
MNRWAWVEVSEAAIEHNVRQLAAIAAPSRVWAVVKANGYGHGAVASARAALAGGAQGLCVALVQEGVELRDAGVTAPILVLSEQPPETAATAISAGLTSTVYGAGGIAALAAAGGRLHPVHLKIDTGMRRVGADPVSAVAIADMIESSPAVTLAGVFTHLAVADEPGNDFTSEQLRRFDEVLNALSAAGHRPPVVHAANSAAAMLQPNARRDFVRAGIAIYGLAPAPSVASECRELHPALSLHARVAFVKQVRAGERISYGLHHRFERDTTVATLPLGYADGVPRKFQSVGGEVLLGGIRRPIVGIVTMDQLLVDCGPAGGDERQVAVGDHAVLIGRQGDEEITVADWAQQLGVIGYEVVCGLSSRLERRPA